MPDVLPLDPTRAMGQVCVFISFTFPPLTIYVCAPITPRIPAQLPVLLRDCDCHLLYVGFLLGLFFDHENGGDMFHRNVG
jgi:hypothetical protein